ncbi:hypothetical protein INS49_000950 [Diaporthe citri]|uniref:uncharacterized protein n=1 Tax=Diaporthe citri TaxID=83186 RepID=UPI001C81144A|nr:uncharacterized protein INS49_000950 [Diaporthe citri]KAG6366770.1 hypothetical protein INS49_000950 [Diaporthe citri]
MPSKPQFALGDQNAGIFAEICQKNGMTHCWLQWKFEIAVLSDATSPFTIDTKSDALCGLKDGVSKVIFTIDFDQNNPNVINYIKFSEFYNKSVKKHFIVTQTSVDHVQEDTACKLWLQLPPNALHEDISAVVNLWRVQICCDEWKDFLPANPATQLEKSHRVVSEGNAQWLKKQLIRREGLLAHNNAELAARNKDIESLTTQISELSMQLADAEKKLEDSQSLSLATPRKRKLLTPKSRARKTPRTARTAPEKSFATGPVGRAEQFETPTKEPKFQVVLKGVQPDDPFVD